MKEIISIVENILKIFQTSLDELKILGFNPLYPFPRGWCEEVSLITHTILTQKGFRQFEVIKGISLYDNQVFHFWLESSDYIIDLTAHQFKDCEVTKPILLIKKEDYPLRGNFIRDRAYENIPLRDFEITKLCFIEKYYEIYSS